MTTGQIIDAIWKLPWYKVLYIAMIDDGIALLKSWWFFLIIGIIVAIIFLWFDN